MFPTQPPASKEGTEPTLHTHTCTCAHMHRHTHTHTWEKQALGWDLQSLCLYQLIRNPRWGGNGNEGEWEWGEWEWGVRRQGVGKETSDPRRGDRREATVFERLGPRYYPGCAFSCFPHFILTLLLCEKPGFQHWLNIRVTAGNLFKQQVMSTNWFCWVRIPREGATYSRFLKASQEIPLCSQDQGTLCQGATKLLLHSYSMKYLPQIRGRAASTECPKGTPTGPASPCPPTTAFAQALGLPRLH